MDKKELKIVSPWVDFYKKLEAFFKFDPEIRVEYDNEIPLLKIYVESQDKYEALSRVLPSERAFGNVALKIELIPANVEKLPTIELFRRAFKGNPAVTDIISVPGEAIGSSNDFNYIVCKKEVVQYHNDTLADPHGTCSTLYQELGREIFGEQGGIYFCTDRE